MTTLKSMNINYNLTKHNNKFIIILIFDQGNFKYTFDFSLGGNKTWEFIEYINLINNNNPITLELFNEEEDRLLKFIYNKNSFIIDNDEHSYLDIKDASSLLKTFNNICNDIQNSY